jgi:hypothetical protein
MLQYAAMDPFEFHRLGLGRFDPEKATRRQVWLEVYLPFALCVLLLAAGVLVLGGRGVGNSSVWADISLSLLLAIVLAFGLVLLVVLASAAVGVWYLTRELPSPFAEARMTLARARRATVETSDRAVKAVIVPSAGLEAIRAALRHLAGIFRR